MTLTYANPLVLPRELRRRQGLAGEAQLGSWLSSAFKKVTGVNLSQAAPALLSTIPVVGGVVSQVISASQAAAAGPQQPQQQQQTEQAEKKDNTLLWVGAGVAALLLLKK